MILTRLTYPETELADGHICQFSHGFNSLYVDVARQDYAITGSQSNAGYLVLNVADSSVFSVQQNIYFAGFDTNGDLVKSGTALIWDIGTGWIAILELATNPPNEIVSGTINEISDNKREVEISGEVSDGDLSWSFTPRRFSYDENGLVRVYLNSILKSIFTARYDIDESIHNEIQKGAGLYLDGIFCKDIDTDTDIELLTEKYIAVKSVQQIGHDNRLVEFEVYNTGVIHSTAKFMTAFEKPKYFKNFPHTIMAAIGDNSSTVFYRHEFESTIVNTMMNLTGKGIYKMKVEQYGSERTFDISLIAQDETQTFNLSIDEDGNTLEIDSTGNKLKIQ